MCVFVSAIRTFTMVMRASFKLLMLLAHADAEKQTHTTVVPY